MWYILGLLALLASVRAGLIPRVPRDTHLQYPVCRPSSVRCTEKYHFQNENVYKVNGHELIVDFLDGSYFKLRCNSDSKYSSMLLDDPEMPAFSWPMTVDVAVFNQCLIPQDTYYAALKAFNVTVTKTLRLRLPADSKLEVYHLRGLQITNLEISAVHSLKPPRPSFDFLDEVPGLRILKLTDVVPEPEAFNRLPTSLEILNIINGRLLAAERVLQNDKNNARHWLERLNSLQSLLLSDSSAIVAEYPGEIFTLPQLSSLTNLVSMSLHYMPLESDKLTSWLKNSTLKYLTLQSCLLTTLPKSMFKGARLTKLTLAYNQITYLPLGLFTPLKDSLQELDLSYNKLNQATVLNSVKQLGKLVTLKANNNSLGSLCGDASIVKVPLNSELPTSLRRLELRNTGATRICSDWIKNDSLMDIDLSNNNITEITYSDLEMTRTERGTVRLNLKKNNLQKIDVSRSDHQQCQQQAKSQIPDDSRVITRVQVELDLDRLPCDCNAYWLREVLRSCSPLLKLKDDVECSPEPTRLHTKLLQYLPDEISCPYTGECLPECSCKNRPRDNATVMFCTGALPRDPHWPLATKDFPLALHVAPGMLAAVPNITLVELHAPNNNITMLADKDVSDTLRVLDVRNNSISRISLNASKVLAQIENVTLYLSGNRLACECNDVPAFSHLNLVGGGDWNLTQCVDMSLASGKTERDLCPSPLPIVFGIVFPLLLIAVVCLTVYLLWPRVKQFMFRHDLFANWILRECDDTHDPEKTDDAFLSYSYVDLDQLKELKNGLEKLGYSTIEHQTDWQPGDAVLEQITKSVLKARRTLLLVTDNFAESEWTPVEFRIAHRHALKTRTKRVLIVNCGLQKPKKLPLDLQIYLESHTYLEWDDPKFWHKLRRFMPPPRQASVQLKPEDLDPPSPLMQQNFALFEKSPEKIQLVAPLLSINTVPSAC
ncbi:protein toll-like [Cydia splendana]|uniref:protein toll-like n=1 Tax=Cydia splendana TaxID=1100963 RepID=UPI00213403A6